MRMRITLPLAAIAAVSVVAIAGAEAEDGGRRFTVLMTGAAERPGPGDPDGAGTAVFRVNAGQRRICYTLAVQDIEPATAAHIHRAPATAPGPVVVPLDAPTDGNSENCATVTRELAQEIIRSPTSFYVNVHNAPFPAGAVRGNLTRSPN